MLPNDLRTIFFDAKVLSSYIIGVMLHSISADREVRNLPVAYRKCRYEDENDLEYYSVSLTCLTNVASMKNQFFHSRIIRACVDWSAELNMHWACATASPISMLLKWGLR